MKKYLLALALIVPIVAFTGCGGDGGSNSDGPDASKISSHTIAGVWECGDQFISFTTDGFYCAFLTDKFIASGSYVVNGDEVRCYNTYYGTDLFFNVSAFDDKMIRGDISYVDFDGNPTEAYLILRKSDKRPTPKDNVLIGKSYTYLIGYTGSVDNSCTISFDTFNTAKEVLPLKTKADLQRNWHYIYLAPYVYYQQFAAGSGLQSFYQNCGTGEVFRREATIEAGRLILSRTL